MNDGLTPPQPTFASLGLSPLTLTALEVAGYQYPTPVQAGLIPRALTGIDVVGQARTGTGKTASFVLPILEKINLVRGDHRPRAIVMVPTRELAVQVRDETMKLSHGRKFNCVAVYGGKPLREQIEKLRHGSEMIVGTPGRVLDHLSRRTLDLGALQMVVLDEADRMLDIGFRPDIERILRQCPDARQTLLLSATVPPPIEKLAQRYMRNPEFLNFSPKELAVETIDQYYFTVDHERKFDLLLRLLAREKPRQAIIFCRTKRSTEKIFLRLAKKLPFVASMHGDMAQSARDRVMRAFRDEKIRVLVATDVIGRGIDVSTISHIINYDVPTFSDDYVHRVGRTGRMGRDGVAYTFVSPEEGHELTRIEERINRLLKRDEIKDFQAVSSRASLPGAPGSPNGAGENGNEPAVTGPAPPPPPSSAMKRAPRKYRKAL